LATLTNTLAVSSTRRLSLAVLSLAAAAGAVVFRLLGTRTTGGRRFDLSAVQSGLALPKHALDSSDVVLTAVSFASFLLIGGLLVGVSLIRRRFDLAAAVAVTLGGSFATTEFLKSHLHHRGGVTARMTAGFPSGHSTVALALGLSFVLVTPDRRRLVAATAAALYAALMGATLVFYSWHFPSDVGGGFCIATAWAAGAALFARGPLERGIPGRLVTAAIALVLLAASAALYLRPGLDFTITSPGRLWTAAAGIALFAAGCCAAFAYACSRCGPDSA
jgi:membrane-associated phospholipid phosphatase